MTRSNFQNTVTDATPWLVMSQCLPPLHPACAARKNIVGIETKGNNAWLRVVLVIQVVMSVTFGREERSLFSPRKSAGAIMKFSLSAFLRSVPTADPQILQSERGENAHGRDERSGVRPRKFKEGFVQDAMRSRLSPRRKGCGARNLRHVMFGWHGRHGTVTNDVVP